MYRDSRLTASYLPVRYEDHAEKLHEVSDEYLTEALQVAKKIALALGAENYNLLQVRTPSLVS